MNKNEIEKVLENIHFIKEVISRDSVYLQKFIESKGLRYLSLFFGLVLSMLSFLAYFFLSKQIVEPITFRWILAISIILLVIITGLLKWKIWDFLFPENPWPNMIIKVVGISVLRIIILILTLIIAFTIGLSVVKLYQFILPVWAIGCGILFCIYGSLFNASLALELTGYFIIAGGSLSLFFIHDKPVEAWLWSGIIFGIGFLIYFIVATISSLTRKAKGE
ncbi:MAG: hypothetical protein ACP5Q5_08255 [Brevinematia bacterium]